MNAFERAMLMEQIPPMDFASVVQVLLSAFGLGLIVAWIYRYSIAQRLVAPALVASLSLLPVIAAMVLIVIGNSLARAFSLVGALAIVRFRTRLASTWDISFVFLSLAVGISCGVGAVQIAALGTAIALLAVLVLGVIPGSRPQTDLIVLRCDVSAYQCGEAQLIPVMDKHARRRWLSSARTMRFGESMSLTYRLILNRKATLEELARELSAIEGVERVTVMSDDQTEQGV